MRTYLLTAWMGAFCLSPLAPLPAAPDGAGRQARELDLAGARIEGGVFQGGEIVPAQVYSLPRQGALAAEAEAASEIRPPASVTDGEGVSGGKCVHLPDRSFAGQTAGLIYLLDVPEPGAYRFWIRTFWPDVGGNSFFLQLDEGERVTWGNDETPGRIGQWFWLEGPEWQLTAGRHRVAIWWREDGSSIDKVALGPAGYAPEGLGAEPATPRLAERITVEFPAFRPPLVRRWLRTALEVRGRPRDLRLTVRDASGREIPVAAGGDLSAVPVADPRGSPLVLTATLAPDAETAIRGARLEYEGEPSALDLAGGKLALTFDLTSGSLLRLRRRDTDLDALVAPAGIPFRLQVWHHETRKLEWLPDAAAHLVGVERASQGAAPAARFRYRVDAPGGTCTVTCRVSLHPTDPVATWQAEVENSGRGFDVVVVVCPALRHVAVGRDGADDWLAWPHWIGAGQLIPKPMQNAPGRGLYCSGRATMQWLDVYDKAAGGRGLYLAAEDETWLVGALGAEPRPEIGAVDLSLSKMPRIRPGERWTSPRFVCALHDGDWHAGADRYREWIGRHVRYDPPAWVRECDGWLGRGRGSRFLEDIPRHYRAAKDLGLDYVEFWGQMMVGAATEPSCCNRLYFPDPRYGSEAEFTQAVRYVRDAGGHIGFYTNGQAWNPRYPKLRPEYDGLVPPGTFIPDWEREYHRYGVIQADGSPVPQYAKPAPDDPYPGAFLLMCPATEGWPRYLHHYIVGKYAAQYGVDAMYVDQVGAAEAQPCFATDHLHREVGAWTRGHMENFRRLREDGRKHDPQFALATEGFGDCYGRYVDIFLISPASCGASPYAYPGLVRYTLPDRVCFDGFANGNVGHRPGRDVLDDVFLVGNRFDMFPRAPEEMEHFRKLLALRQEVGPLLYRGRYRDDLDLKVSDARVRARWWTLDPAQADGVLVALLNPEGIEGATVEVPFPAPGEPRVLTASLDRKLTPDDCMAANGRVSVSVPVSPASVALITSRVKLDPPVLARVMAPVGAVGAASEMVLRWRPLERLSGQARVGVEVPEGWRAEGAVLEMGEAADVPLRVWAPADAPKRGHPVVVSVEAPGRTPIRLPAKLLLHDALEAELRAQGGDAIVTVKSSAAEALSGTCTLAAPGWLPPGESRKPFSLPARGTTEVIFELPARKIDRQVDLRAEVAADGPTARASLTLSPPDLGLTQWKPQRYEGIVAANRVGEGAGAALLVETTGTTSRGGWLWRSGVPAPGTRWRFRAEARTEEVSGEGGACVRIIFLHRSKVNAGTRPPIQTAFITGTTGWQAIEESFEVPPETGAVQVELFNWHARGRSYWRSLSLE